MAFSGTYEHSLDEKNRLTVPREFRAELAGGVVLAKGVGDYVCLWTPEGFEDYKQATLSNYLPASEEWDTFKRFFFSSAFHRKLDGVHRVTLLPALLHHAGLRKEVTVIGNDTCLEVWDRAAWIEYDATLASQVSKIRKLLGHTA